MENSTTEYQACPHCGGRLVAGATICLHCNEEVAAQKVESQGALGKFLLTALVLIGALGLGATLLVDAVTDDAEKKIPKSKVFDGDEAPEVVCVDVTKLNAIAELASQGLREVAGPPGSRCFAK